MTTENTTSDLMAMIKDLTQNKSTPSGWQKASNSSDADIQAVSVPISLETNSGKLRVYLHFDGSNAASPEALYALVEKLEAQGLPLDTWKPKNKGWQGDRSSYKKRW